MANGDLASVVGVLAGVKPVVIAIVVEAVLRIGGRALKRQIHFVVACAAFIGIFFLHVPFPLIVLAAGLIGLCGGRFLPTLFAAIPPGGGSSPSSTALDDITQSRAPTLPSRIRAWQTLGVGMIFWTLPFFALIVWSG